MSIYTQYTYRTVWSEEDGEFVGLCSEFPSLSWLDETQQGALQGITDLVNAVATEMGYPGEEVPILMASE
ncbi:MAG: hypothetical protein KDE58_41230 [Caldilineaceae bacterium]|nr:hypothetical protein [Caldilineaceae bacterium]